MGWRGAAVLWCSAAMQRCSEDSSGEAGSRDIMAALSELNAQKLKTAQAAGDLAKARAGQTQCEAERRALRRTAGTAAAAPPVPVSADCSSQTQQALKQSEQEIAKLRAQLQASMAREMQVLGAAVLVALCWLHCAGCTHLS